MHLTIYRFLLRFINYFFAKFTPRLQKWVGCFIFNAIICDFQYFIKQNSHLQNYNVSKIVAEPRENLCGSASKYTEGKGYF